MSRVDRKEARRHIVRQALEEKFLEFVSAGSHVEASAIVDALTALDFDESERTYSELYERYVMSGQIDHGPAALGAFYSLFCPNGESPQTALRDGFQIDVSQCTSTRIELPAWIVMEFLRAIDLYLSGKRKSLNEAFGIGGGKRGRTTVLSPVDDFDTTVAFAYFRVNQILRGDGASRSKAKRNIEEYAANWSSSDKTGGFDSRTTAGRLARIKRAYPPKE